MRLLECRNRCGDFGALYSRLIKVNLPWSRSDVIVAGDAVAGVGTPVGL